MEKLKPFERILGDTIGYCNPRYEDVPEGFGFESIANRPECPLTNQQWGDLIDFAQRYYRKFEIVGETWADFAYNLQTEYNRNSDTFERLLEVYDDDIAKPILGRVETVVYDLTSKDDGSHSDSGSDTNSGGVTNNTTVTNNLKTTVNNSSQTDNIDVPVNSDSPNTQIPSSVVKDSSDSTTDNTGTVKTEGSTNDTTKVTRQSSGTNNLTHTQSGTVKTTLSDLGVRPNYESLNGFLDNNRTKYDVFVWMFRNCFQICEVLKW